MMLGKPRNLKWKGDELNISENSNNFQRLNQALQKIREIEEQLSEMKGDLIVVSRKLSKKDETSERNLLNEGYTLLEQIFVEIDNLRTKIKSFE